MIAPGRTRWEIHHSPLLLRLHFSSEMRTGKILSAVTRMQPFEAKKMTNFSHGPKWLEKMSRASYLQESEGRCFPCGLGNVAPYFRLQIWKPKMEVRMAMAFGDVPGRIQEALEYLRDHKHGGVADRVFEEWEWFLRENGVAHGDDGWASRATVRRWMRGEAQPDPYRGELDTAAAFINGLVPKRLQIPGQLRLSRGGYSDLTVSFMRPTDRMGNGYQSLTDAAAL